MRFRDLGPFAVEQDGVPVPLTGSRLRAVLAVLLVNARTSVSADRIVDAVWGDAPPARPNAALDSLLWRLRRALDPGRAPRGSGLVRTTTHGYALGVPDDAIDSRQFLVAGEAAIAALRQGDPDAALRACESALDRWRGHPFADVPDTGWLAPERERLRQAWIDVSETRLQALLDLGRPEQAASDALAVLADHPYRERVWAQRILGLYRAGRQADALAGYEQARRVMADDLGVDPGPGLLALHRAVLTQDPALRPPDPVAAAPAGPRRRWREVRLFGRDDDLADVLDLLEQHRLVTVTGPMGVGKTALALSVAARSVDPIVVELAAVTDDAGLLGALAAALGLGSRTTDPRGAVVDRLRAARLLLVLDNCEQVLAEAAEVITDVLAAAPDVRVLATSREPLSVSGERAHRLGPLPAAPAATLFWDRAGQNPDAGDVDLVDGICAAVGGLPLGIELAARRARSFRLAEIAASVQDDPGGLARDPRSSRPDRTLGAAIEQSHRLLTPPEQAAHRGLSVLAGPFTVAAAAAALDLGMSATMDLLAALAHRSMLTAQPQPHRPTRFRQLEPLRADARDRLVAAGEAEVSRARRAQWATRLLREGPRRGRPGQRAWYEQLDDDWATLALTIDAELDRPGDTGAVLAVAVQGFCYDRNRTPQGLAWLERPVAGAGLGAFPLAAARIAYGAALILTRRADLGRPHLDAGVAALASASGGPDDVAGVLVDAAAACWVGDEYERAGRLARDAHRHAVAAGARHEADLAEAVGIAADYFTGDPDDAHRRALDLLGSGRIADNGQAQLFTCATAGIAAIGSDPAAGLRWTEQALRGAAHLGALNLGGLLEQRAGHLLRAGRSEDAARCLAASAAHARHLGEPWPGRPGTAEMIRTLRADLPADRYRAAEAAGGRIIAAHGIDVADWV